MRKSVLIMVLFAMFLAFSAVSCGEKQTVDERANVKELVAKGEYQQAKAKLVTLRGQYPNDQELTELNRQVDEKIAESFYQKYWDEAEQKGDHKAWIEAMIRIKKVENINKEMVNGWIKRAAEKCVDAGAKSLNDGMLLALLDQLVQRYQVITMNDRLMYITMFVKEGRFPLKEWKDTFITKYPELMDEETEEFLGWPRPEKPAKK